MKVEQLLIKDKTNTGMNLFSVYDTEVKQFPNLPNSLFSGMTHEEISQYIESNKATRLVAELHNLISYHTGNEIARTEENATVLVDNLILQVESLTQDIEYLKADIKFLNSFKQLLNNEG